MFDLEILRVLSSFYGSKFYPVGGCVRDALLGENSKDVDLCTAVPVQKILDNPPPFCTVYPLGLEHGTVTVIFAGESFEISTFRKDVSCDGRHAVVAFTDSIDVDLSRRDFTINAMAFDVETQRVIDPFGGQIDLSRKIIRTVGDPETRFAEDHLRMLRACRFVAKYAPYGFDIEEKTMEAIQKMAHLISNVSKERVRDELLKMMKTDMPMWCVDHLDWSGLMSWILPLVSQTIDMSGGNHHKESVFTHLRMVCNLVSKDKPLLRLAALLHDIGKVPTLDAEGKFINHHVVGSKIVGDWAETMKFSNEDKDFLVLMVREHMFSLNPQMNDASIRRLLIRVGDHWKDLLELKRADLCGRIPCGVPDDVEVLLQRIETIATTPTPLSVKDLTISGKDLIETFGLKPGPLFGKILNACLEKVLDDPEVNNRDKLFDIVRELLNT